MLSQPDPQKTRFIGNDRVQQTAAFTSNPDARVDTSLLARKVAEKLQADHIRYVDGTGLALALSGDTIATNMFMVGVALQLGWLPLSVAAIERAIELNNVQVEFNKRALSWGRLWVHDPAAVEKAVGDPGAAVVAPAQMDVDTLIAPRISAHRLSEQAPGAALSCIGRRSPRGSRDPRRGRGRTAETRGRAWANQLMAYKDEYEWRGCSRCRRSASSSRPSSKTSARSASTWHRRSWPSAIRPPAS
ncbi:MAG: hypothetical protein R3E83_10135 [Burkholderiaceae bacterium]